MRISSTRTVSEDIPTNLLLSRFSDCGPVQYPLAFGHRPMFVIGGEAILRYWFRPQSQ